MGKTQPPAFLFAESKNRDFKNHHFRHWSGGFYYLSNHHQNIIHMNGYILTIIILVITNLVSVYYLLKGGIQHASAHNPSSSMQRNDFTTMLTVKTENGRFIKLSVYDYVRQKTELLRQVHHMDVAPSDVREALENVLNGMVHEPIEIYISNDIVL